MSSPRPATLLDLFADVPAGKVAVISPEKDIRVTYGELRTQVQACAEAASSSGEAPACRPFARPSGLMRGSRVARHAGHTSRHRLHPLQAA